VNTFGEPTKPVARPDLVALRPLYVTYETLIDALTKTHLHHYLD
jgi:hypothetical protein